MTAAVYDFAAIAKLTKAFAEEPPQNEVKPVEAPRAEVFRWAYKAACDDFLTANAPAAL